MSETNNKFEPNEVNNIDKKLNDLFQEIAIVTNEIRNTRKKIVALDRKLSLPIIFIKQLIKIVLRPLASFKYLIVKHTIKKSKLFDKPFYLINNPDVDVNCVDPLKHFILHGYKEGRNPHPLFDISFYMNKYSDVRIKDMNPVYHFIKFGLKEGRVPSDRPQIFELFRHQYLPKSKFNLFYVGKTIKQALGILKSKKFNKEWYWNEYKDVYEEAKKNPLWRYRDSSVFLIRKFARLITHPVWHYVTYGVYEGRNPTINFDTKYYLNRYGDVTHSKMNPFFHYCVFGQYENRVTQDRNQKYSSNKFINRINTGYISIYQKRQDNISFQPLVTIIVPNYNHARFLRQRLESIYNQTYHNYEVILLDDCSSDNSREILLEYYNMYPEKTRYVFNEHNSGGVFYQWEKGLSLANGELVWIAESDDWCTENFLEEMVPYFQDEAVMLAYCNTIFVNQHGDQFWSTQEYLHDLDAQYWNQPFICPAHNLVKNAFSIKNIIPNVSSSVFRKPVKLPILNDETWKSMKIAGDWLFYIHIIRGGLVAYSNTPTNYYRLHKSNTSTKTYDQDVYYKEHMLVSKYIANLYDVNIDVFVKQSEILKEHWKRTRNDFSEDKFEELYNITEIMEEKKNRKPNLLMAGYAFSTGGGETFPIYLANIFKEKGYSVTFLNFDQTERVKGIREMLYRDIPVITNFHALEKIVEDFGVQVIHSHHAWVDNTIIDLLPPELEYEHVITLHGMYEMLDKKLAKEQFPRLIQRTSKLVYIAEKNLIPFKELNLYDQNQFKKIGNAILVDSIEPVDLNQYGISKDAFVICLVSRAIPEKGWQEAIESVKQVRKQTKRDVHLLLIGDGPEYVRLKNEVLPNYIHVLGFKNKVENYFAASDLGILPTRFKGESYPLVLISCMLAGKPFLCTNVGEVSEMLRGKDDLAGSLIELNSNWKIPIDRMVEEISKYVTDPLYYESKLKEVPYAAEKFSIDKLYSEYNSVYMESIRK